MDGKCRNSAYIRLGLEQNSIKGAPSESRDKKEGARRDDSTGDVAALPCLTLSDVHEVWRAVSPN